MIRNVCDGMGGGVRTGHERISRSMHHGVVGSSQPPTAFRGVRAPDVYWIHNITRRTQVLASSCPDVL